MTLELTPGLRRPRLPRRTAHVHNMVLDTARDLCLAQYEVLMSNNDIRKEWKRTHPGAGELGLQAAFVKKYVYSFVGPARATLATMLSGPYDEGLKSSIHEALCLDNTLVRGRNAPVEANHGE